MNSNTDKTLSPEELKRRNLRDLQIAGKSEVQVVLTQENWQALVSLMDAVLKAQEKHTLACEELLKRNDVELHLTILSDLETKIVEELQDGVTDFQQQAGNLNAKFSSASDKLVQNSQQAVAQITEQHEKNLRRSREEMERDLSRLREVFRTWLLRLTLLAAGSITLLTTLFSSLMWQLH